MKYISANIFIVLATFIILQLFNNVQSQNSIGFTGGINFSNVKFDYSGEWAKYEPKGESQKKPYLGIRIESLFGNHELTKGMFQTGLFANFMGSNLRVFGPQATSSDIDLIVEEYYDQGYDSVNVSNGPLEAKLNLVYLELPLHFGVSIKGIKVFFGPYFRFGLSANYKTKISYTVEATQDYPGTLPPINEKHTIKENQTVQFETGRVEKAGLDDDNIYYKIYDYGLDYGIGYQYKSLLLTMHYSMGLANIVTEIEGKIDPDDVNQQNNLFNISLTVIF